MDAVVFEGLWEDVVIEHIGDLIGRQVRVTVLAESVPVAGAVSPPVTLPFDEKGPHLPALQDSYACDTRYVEQDLWKTGKERSGRRNRNRPPG